MKKSTEKLFLAAGIVGSLGVTGFALTRALIDMDAQNKLNVDWASGEGVADYENIQAMINTDLGFACAAVILGLFGIWRITKQS